MDPLAEPVLIAVGMGVTAFCLAALAVATAAAQNTLEQHMLQARAMEIRNRYLRNIAAIRRPVAAVADEELGEVEIIEAEAGEAGQTAPLRRAA